MENVHVAALQRLFTNDELSFLYGKSCYNQHIEAFWGMLWRGCVDEWIKFLKTLGIVVCSGIQMTYKSSALSFALQALYGTSSTGLLWNGTCIEFDNAESPSGQPDVLYSLSSRTDDARDLITPDEFVELASTIMLEKHLEMPTNSEDAVILHLTIVEEIEQIL